MIAKQDRQGARTATDIERKYNFGEKFSEFMGAASDARSAAERAESAASNLDNSLSPDGIFNRLTENGNVEAFIKEDGQIYINASFLIGVLFADLIKRGVLSAQDGAVKFDLEKDEISVEIAGGVPGALTFDSKGMHLYGQKTESGSLEEVLSINLERLVNSSSPIFASIFSRQGAGLAIDADGDLMLKGKVVSWHQNGDGTFTLIGT